MDDTSLTSHLLSALPEELWAEVTRRLRAHPQVWRAAHEPALLEAFLKAGTDLAQWRPGPLGLAGLAASAPQAADAEHAEGWLLASEAGKARVDAALAAVRAWSNELDLVESAVAAIAARGLRDGPGGPWSELAREAAGPQAARWRLPLACLYGLIDDPVRLVRCLLKSEADPEAGPALAADVLLLNCTADETVALVQRLAGELRRSQLLTFAHALVAAGAADLAARISQGVGDEDTPKTAAPGASWGQPEDLPAYTRQAAGEVEQALVRRWAGDLDTAQRGLAAALGSIQQLAGMISTALGQVASEAGDYVTALAAYQAALIDGGPGVDAPALHGLKAQALVALGRPAEALAALSALPEPPPLAMAGAQHALDRGEEARQWATRASLAAPDPAPHPAVAAYHLALAKLLSEVGDTEAAVEAQKRAVACHPWDGAGQARLADMLWQARRFEAAHSAALQAMAFGPEAPRFAARQIVAQYLAQRGKHAAAVEQWKAALAHTPGDIHLSLSLAASALASGQLPLAKDAAQAALDAPAATSASKSPAARWHAEARRILGEVAAALGDDETALQQFEQALRLDPGLPTPWLAIAGHRRKSGDLTGALEVLARAEKSAPKSAEIVAALAQLYDDLGRSSEAIDAMSRAADLAPAEAAYQRGLGLLLYRHRYLQGAIGAFRQAVQLAPADAVSLHHLALALVAEEGESEEAFEIMQQGAALEPDDPTPYKDLGQLALRLNHVDAAQAALKTAIDRQGEPGDTGTLALLGEAYEAAGDHLNALDAYRQSVSLSPTRTDLNLRIGVCCLAAGQTEAAIASLLEAVEADLGQAEASVEAHRELGRAYAAAGMWSEAAMSFEYAATLSPETAELHRLHGRAALQVAKSPGADAAHWHNRAVAALSRAAQLNSGRPDAGTLAELGLALTSVGRLEEARQAYDAALVLAPNSASLRADIASLMTGFGEHTRASDLLAEAAAIAPDDVTIAHAWAKSCLAAGRHEAGHKAFVRAAELAGKGLGKAADVKRAGYLRQAGECLWTLGRFAEAIGLWQKALEIDSGDRETRARLGTALLQQGRPAEAMAHLEAVAEGAEGEVLLTAARAAIGSGRYDRAVVHLERAIAQSPDEAETHYLYGQALAAVDQPAPALEEFRRAARLDPRQGLYPAAIARALAAQGDTVEAVASVETALELSGDQPQVLAAAGEVFMAVEEYPRAAEVLQRAAEAQPNLSQMWVDLARALTLLVEAEAPLAEAGVPLAATDGARHSIDSPATRSLLNHALHKAAVLGASPNTVREWTGRARAFVGDAKEAIVLLESVAASPSSMPSERRAEIYRALGHAYRRDDAFDRARNSLETAIATARQSDGAAKTRRLSPASRIYPETLLELGQTSLALGDTTGALNAGRRAAAAAPRNPVYLHFLGEALSAMGDRREASAALERALAMEPGVAHWHAQLAETLRGPKSEPGDVAAVLEHLRAAAALEPDNPSYALDLARALAENGDQLAAANEYRRATDLAPDSAEAWREWGQLALHLGGADMANECFDRALALAPGDGAALVGSAQAALALGRLGEAQTKAGAALRLNPGNPSALACAAEVCAARGDTSGALEANAKAIAGAPAQAEAVQLRLSRARFLRAAGRLNDAIATLEQLANDEPEADEAYGMLGDALMVTKRFDEAMDQYRRALELAPDSALHLLRLGRACLEAGQLDQALAHLLQSRDRAAEPAERADVEREIGKTYEARRQIDRALEAYHEAINLNPDQAENFFRAAMAHKLLKQYQEAGQLFQRVVELDPSNVEAHRQLVQVAAFELLQGAKLAAGVSHRV